jgi:superfamily II DNA or RNA helicase
MFISKNLKYYQIQFAYKPFLVEAVKRLPGRRWDGVNKCWLVPLDHAADVAAFGQRYGFTFATKETQQSDLDSDSDNVYEIKPLPELTVDLQLAPDITPYPYQKQGIARGLELKRFLNGDKPGLGKTIQAIATVHTAKAYPCLVICPATLKENWKREFAKCTGKNRALILYDGNKKTFPQFHQAGMTDAFICNYESLKKYFVAEIKKSKRLTLRDIIFKPEIKMFKSVIIDECHRCLTYENKILTNKGLIPIGKIVEKKMKNLYVATYNFSKKCITFEKILNVYKNEITGRELRKISAGNRCITATADHKIYVEGRGWQEAIYLQNRENLYCLPSEIYGRKSRKSNSRMLQQVLRISTDKLSPGSSRENGQKQTAPEGNQKVPMVRKGICRKKQNLQSRERSFLFAKLFGKVANEATRNFSKISNRGNQEKEKRENDRTNEKSCFAENALGKNESKQPNQKPRNIEKNIGIIEREKVCCSWGKWNRCRAANGFVKCAQFVGKLFGICNKYAGSPTSVRATRILLQSGHCNYQQKNSNRSGWLLAQNKQSESIRPKENRNIECVRLDSNTRAEQRHFRKLTFRYRKNKFVYDIEIANNHNYFANGILVHNCKDSATQQSKLCMGICSGKEYVILLSGTPVINKPKDLISQLHIMNRLPDFGGYKGFTDRYCAGMNAASNLRELNRKLNQTCFFQREKKDVLKDLPAKVRQTVICEINNRQEYADAENDLIRYLREYRQASDEKIRKSMRGEVMVRIGVLRNISARGKITTAAEFVQDLIEQDEKVILFINLHEVHAALKKIFPKAVSVTGQDSRESRQAAIDNFQTNPEVKLILCSIKAAGVGLTLTASSNVCFLEFPWTYADCEQCEDRAHRIGQKDNVTAYYFLGKNTFDEQNYKIIQTKKDLAATITGSAEQIEENIVDMVTNLFLEKKEFAL